MRHIRIHQTIYKWSNFSSSKGEIHELEVNLDNLLSLFHGNTCSRYTYPSQGTQAMLTQTKRQRKFELFNPSQLEEQLEEQHRQGAGVQPYPVIT